MGNKKGQKMGTCAKCGGNDLEFLGNGKYKCRDRKCGNIGDVKEWVNKDE